MQSPDLISESQTAAVHRATTPESSPATRGAAAARISPAESSKASAARIRASETATTRASAKTATTQQIAQKHTGEEATATAASAAAGPDEPKHQEQSA